MSDNIVHFLRAKDFELRTELGRGACGRTVLLHDPLIHEQFVCKKYAPIQEERRQELFNNFVREIKLLHRLHHPNIVRVFNYYLYPNHLAGYILMEHIAGTDIHDYCIRNPEYVNDIFVQVVSAFSYLERNGILHRDIRPQNILISDEGVAKIIDFGFGKTISSSEDFDKSVSLNWWCTPPNEFSDHVYDFSTEVYFVGKLFERVLLDGKIEQFAFPDQLAGMCNPAHRERNGSFSRIEQYIQAGGFGELQFSDSERESYQALPTTLANRLLRSRMVASIMVIMRTYTES